MAVQDRPITRPKNTNPINFAILFSAPLVDETSQGRLKPVAPLQIQEELNSILEGVSSLPNQLGIDISINIATQENFRKLMTPGFGMIDILHFSGHGSLNDSKTAITFEGQNGKTDPIKGGTLQEWLYPFRRSSEPPFKIVVLNACHSEGLARTLLSNGVKHVIAINGEDKISDDAARTFSKWFYYSLLGGESIIEAFRNAQSAVKSDESLNSRFDETTHMPVKISEEVKFRLLPEGSVTHEKPLYSEFLSGEIKIYRKGSPTNLLPKPSEPFDGRQNEVHEIVKGIQGISDKRCFAIHGIGGMGKTALALAVGRWMQERNFWKDGVWSINLRNVKTADEARANIGTALDFSSTQMRDNNSLGTAIAQKQVLLILDDLDQLLEEDQFNFAELLNTVLGCLNLNILTTSRKNLPSNVFYEPIDLEKVDQIGALSIFRRNAPPPNKWGDDPQILSKLDEIMNFLDGFPFPIRLAARYMARKHISLGTLHARLLSKGRAPLEHSERERNRDNSLDYTLNLSFEALPAEVKNFLPSFALFPNGLTDDAAKGIFGDTAVQNLEELHEFSMAEVEDDYEHRRFSLPEPARDWAERKFASSELLNQIAPTTLIFFDKYCELLMIKFRHKTLKKHSAKQLVRDQSNFRRFVEWGLENEMQDDRICRSARITASLAPFWLNSSQYELGKLKDILKKSTAAAIRSNDQNGQALLYYANGILMVHQKENEEAKFLFDKAFQIFQSTHNYLGMADIYRSKGLIQELIDPSDKQMSLEFHAQALEFYLKGIKENCSSINYGEKTFNDLILLRINFAMANYRDSMNKYGARINDLLESKGELAILSEYESSGITE